MASASVGYPGSIRIPLEQGLRHVVDANLHYALKCSIRIPLEQGLRLLLPFTLQRKTYGWKEIFARSVSTGDPFRVVAIPYLLSAGRTDLRLLRGDAFSVFSTATYRLNVRPMVERKYLPVAWAWATPFRVVVIPYLLSAGRTDLRLLRGDAFSVFSTVPSKLFYPHSIRTRVLIFGFRPQPFLRFFVVK